MRTLTNTQITKIENVVANFLEKEFNKKDIDMSNLKMINNKFKNDCIELQHELEDACQYQFENEIEDRLTKKKY